MHKRFPQIKTHFANYLVVSKNNNYIFAGIANSGEEAAIELGNSFDKSLLQCLLAELGTIIDFATLVFFDKELIPLLQDLAFAPFTTWYILTLAPRLTVATALDYERKLMELAKTGLRPKLLLHSCCGPCSTTIISALTKYFAITVLYYNPNIYPLAEYEKRLAEQKRLIACIDPGLKLVIPPFSPDEFYQAVKGLEQEQEGSTRCFACYRLRLAQAASYAKEHSFDFFTTTLSISPYKNAEKINEIGQDLAKGFGVSFLYSNFKQKGGYQKSVALSRKYDLYRQDYCGCVFSKNSKK